MPPLFADVNDPEDLGPAREAGPASPFGVFGGRHLGVRGPVYDRFWHTPPPPAVAEHLRDHRRATLAAKNFRKRIPSRRTQCPPRIRNRDDSVRQNDRT